MVEVKCLECGAVIEAANVEAAIEAFLAHGRQSHTWNYPEEAQRNYARNYAEAAERSTGSAERLPEVGAISVHAVTAERIPDWLQLFDHDAFPDNPGWAACYCLEPHIPPSPDMPERPWRSNRAAMVNRLGDGSTFGYLAYVEGRPGGWLNASLRADYYFFRDLDPAGPDPRAVISLSCFVIAPPYRRHGLASALLDGALAGAADRGAAFVEGYPHREPHLGDAGHFRGPRAMYEARGFVPAFERGNYTVMRRPVA